MAEERLQKILASAGVASRRAAEKYITDGRVKVNGQVVRELGAKADLASDTIVVEGYGKLAREDLVYIALHKPPNVVTTVSDPEGRQTVLDVIAMSRAVGKRRFEGELPRLFPVGRLDFDAEGLLLLTNDGELAQRLLHPSHHAPKTYAVKVKGRPEDKQLERLRRGVRLKDSRGRLQRRATLPADVETLRKSRVNTWLELTIVEGRHHQVKRMCLAIGHQSLRLVRTAFAGIQLDDLPGGAWRFLTAQEVGMLKHWGSGPMPAARPRRAAPSSGSKPAGRGEAKGSRPSKRTTKKPGDRQPAREPAGKKPARKKTANRKPGGRPATRKKAAKRPSRR